MIIEIIFMIGLIVVAGIILNLILDIGSTLLKIVAHIISGWILLTLVNLVPGIYIPINTLTVLISGFGGVVGTVLLAFLYLIF
ncbi:MAG: pro-sigmaK processing inhibitor BofA family protein [Methanosphaera sp.]|uniref:pro-sigmaK processing inhibitor BofA family protein n=1 Tax=Methanosphaera sp. ISO3-F5 TaxID=1452353 RepID=UPI002B256792|nr:pro-sigmaK processing inhibitor BofA family protein [Methanosphaera sp. ISO3-F5]MBR0471842.1 pro-sigmaK processing inhibitor BofA family protein [Methanosphaera sp.]WQH64812.1 pro-sigmaK processing inhibitor BofA family protein [Methanosphaera sp. ISO3-F5]